MNNNGIEGGHLQITNNPLEEVAGRKKLVGGEYMGKESAVVRYQWGLNWGGGGGAYRPLRLIRSI